MNDDEKQQVIDEEQLRWLSFFHYVSGAITLVFSSMFIFHVVIFGIFASNPGAFETENGQSPAEVLMVMRVFATAFGALVVLGITYGILEIVSGIMIRRRRRRIFSMIVAIPRLLCIPYGTILSIFTLILLERPGIRERYESDRNAS